MGNPYCAKCGHHHTDKCGAVNHDDETDAASRCGCTR